MCTFTISALGMLRNTAEAVSSANDKIAQFKSILPMGERLSLAVQVLVVGMATVFSVLILLWAVLKLFKVFSYDIPEKRKKKTAGKKAEETPAPMSESVEVPSEADDSELIAVITAAIEAYNSQNNSNLPFRVVSFKRVKNANGWNARNNETL